MQQDTQVTTVELTSHRDTADLAQHLAQNLQPGHILACNGPIGAGKTTFIRNLVAALGGSPEAVSSPTFALMHVYDVAATRGETSIHQLVHVDAYRLSTDESLDELGVWEMAENNVLCVEWADRVIDQLANEQTWHMGFEHVSADHRRCTYQAPPNEQRTMVNMRQAPS